MGVRTHVRTFDEDGCEKEAPDKVPKGYCRDVIMREGTPRAGKFTELTEEEVDRETPPWDGAFDDSHGKYLSSGGVGVLVTGGVG